MRPCQPRHRLVSLSHSPAFGLAPHVSRCMHRSRMRLRSDQCGRGARMSRRGTPFATYECAFRRPPESGCSAVPTSVVARLPNGNIHQHRRFFINPGLARPSHARPRHVAPCNVRRDHVSRDLGLCPSVTVSRSVLAPVSLCMHRSRMRLRSDQCGMGCAGVVSWYPLCNIRLFISASP